MNILNELIESKNFEHDVLYLLQKINENFGFFYQNGFVYFGKKSVSGQNEVPIDTSYLDMYFNTPIIAKYDDQSFKSGNYDLLVFKGSIEEMYFDIFYKICLSYSNDNSGLSFHDFFDSLVNIFRVDKEKSYNNLIGLIGELIIIKDIYEKYNINISKNWHLTGTNSKFDFAFNKFNIEVKTTTKDSSIYELKHNQLHNNQNNYVAVVSLIETGCGMSLASLKDFFDNTLKFKNDVVFQIAFQNEYAKVTENKDLIRSFEVRKINYYSVFDMDTITSYPSTIEDLRYKYNFTDTKTTYIDEVFKNYEY